MGDLHARLWAWLPARADRRRVTLPAVAAASLGVDARAITEALAELERGGHVVRDRVTGPRGGWHRGRSLPAATPDPPDEGIPLWP